MPWNHLHVGHSSSLKVQTTFARTASAHSFFLHHPVIMCTSILFDTSTFQTDTARQAMFVDERCMCWCQGGGDTELINGISGACEGGTRSVYSRAAMLQMYRQLTRQHDHVRVQYNSLRDQLVDYSRARTVLNDVFRSLQP